MNDLISIRRPQTPADYLALQNVQRGAWGLTDDSYLVPVATLIGADRHGGVVLGAFQANGNAVGMSFAFLAQIRGRLGLYSQLTGVDPAHQGQGIGKRLKLAQRNLARVQQLAVIAWAFDPLQFRNAQFNLTHLGAVGHEYVPDMYGPRTDLLNAHTPTDRLIAVWDVNAVQGSNPRAIPESNPMSLIEIQDQKPVFREIVPTRDRQAHIEIPTNIGQLRQQQPDLALAWQIAVREAFLTAFAAGFVATGLHANPQHANTAYYVLEPADPRKDQQITVISGPDNRENLRLV